MIVFFFSGVEDTGDGLLSVLVSVIVLGFIVIAVVFFIVGWFTRGGLKRVGGAQGVVLVPVGSQGLVGAQEVVLQKQVGFGAGTQ